ncbi:MAG: CoA transferase [Dehalococcoidia bacterium]
MTQHTDRMLPLEGVRVLSQAIVWAGPFGTMILSDLGADVIEVESIQHLNPTRAAVRHLPDLFMQSPTGAGYLNRDNSEGFWNRSATFNYAKRGHRSITLDLLRPEGLELFYSLVREADVFLENNAADVVEDLKIDWPQLSAINPRLIMVRFPGFGISGPYKHFKGYGATMEAIVGHTMLRGYRDSDPSATPPIYHGDPTAGATVAFAIQSALYARERTGEGQLIELSQGEAIVHHLSYALMDAFMNERIHDHWGNRHPWMAPYGLFPCRGDDRWLALAVDSDAAFEALCREMGRPELAAEPRFADVSSRYRNQDILEPLIADWTREHDDRDLMERLQAVGVMATMLAHQPEMFHDPQLQHRGYFIELDHPDTGPRRYPGPLAHFEVSPLTPVRGRAPRLGEHNREVLQGLLGLDDARYQHLVDEQLIGDVYLENAR